MTGTDRLIRNATPELVELGAAGLTVAYDRAVDICAPTAQTMFPSGNPSPRSDGLTMKGSRSKAIVPQSWINEFIQDVLAGLPAAKIEQNRRASYEATSA